MWTIPPAEAAPTEAATRRAGGQVEYAPSPADPQRSARSRAPRGRGRTGHADPERWWYMSDLAAHLDTTPSSLQRELGALADAGILRRRREGRMVYYRAEPEHPLYPELRGLILKTTGLLGVLRGALSAASAR